MSGQLTITQLEAKAADIRKDIIRMLEHAGSGHSAGPLDLADIFTALYFNILKIDPASGKVVAKVDFSKLESDVKRKAPNALEMNGIAYDADTRKIYITGKAWPDLYEVRFN